MVLAEPGDARTELAEAQEPDLGGKPERRDERSLAHRVGKLDERPWQHAGSLLGSQDGPAESDVPVAVVYTVFDARVRGG